MNFPLFMHYSCDSRVTTCKCEIIAYVFCWIQTLLSNQALNTILLFVRVSLFISFSISSNCLCTGPFNMWEQVVLKLYIFCFWGVYDYLNKMIWKCIDFSGTPIYLWMVACIEMQKSPIYEIKSRYVWKSHQQ